MNRSPILAASVLASMAAAGAADATTFTSIVDPANPTFTQALGINDRGQIVGDYVDANGTMFGFVDSGGVFSTLAPTNSVSRPANGINDNGEVVGFYTDGPSDSVVGFVTQVPKLVALTLVGTSLVGLVATRRLRCFG